MVLHLHHVPGRLRVRLSALKGNQNGAKALRSELLHVDGVQSLSVNPWTGSITLHYDRNRFEAAELWTRLRQLGYFCEASRRSPSPSISKTNPVITTAAEALAETLVSAALKHLFGRSAGALVRLLI
jgi:hypothetical protein